MCLNWDEAECAPIWTQSLVESDGVTRYGVEKWKKDFPCATYGNKIEF